MARIVGTVPLSRLHSDRIARAKRAARTERAIALADETARKDAIEHQFGSTLSDKREAYAQYASNRKRYGYSRPVMEIMSITAGENMLRYAEACIGGNYGVVKHPVSNEPCQVGSVADFNVTTRRNVSEVLPNIEYFALSTGGDNWEMVIAGFIPANVFIEWDRVVPRPEAVPFRDEIAYRKWLATRQSGPAPYPAN